MFWFCLDRTMAQTFSKLNHDTIFMFLFADSIFAETKFFFRFWISFGSRFHLQNEILFVIVWMVFFSFCSKFFFSFSHVRIDQLLPKCFWMLEPWVHCGCIVKTTKLHSFLANYFKNVTYFQPSIRKMLIFLKNSNFFKMLPKMRMFLEHFTYFC